MTQPLLRPAPGPWRRVLVVVAVVAVAGMGVFYTNRVEGRLECQARYNEATNARTRILTEASDRERASRNREDDAQAAAFAHPAVLIPPKDRTPQQTRELEALGRRWRDATLAAKKDRDDADRARAENPVPPPPSATCGGTTKAPAEPGPS